MTETYYLACECYMPYKVFKDLKAAKDEIQPYLDKGHSFQVAEVEVKAFHEGAPWKREAA